MAAPAGYPYPPGPMPYMPAVIVKPETLSGIRTYQIALILDIIFGIFALIIGSAALLISPTDSEGGFSLAAIIGASACGLVIVFVINFIVSLTAVTKMHHGSDEYGPEHARNATRGVLFKWLGTGLSTIATVLVVYLLISGTFVLLRGGVPVAAFIPLLVTIFWTAGVTCKGQMYRHMVRALQPPELRFRADVASLVIPTLGIIGVGIVGFVTVRLLTLLQNPGSVASQEAAQIYPALIGGPFLPPGLALAGYILFLTVYLRTSDRLAEGIHQVRAAMPMMPMWPAYPAPIPPPAPMAPPFAPPASVQPPPPPPSTPMANPGTGGCPQCGQPVALGAVFCINCGARVSP